MATRRKQFISSLNLNLGKTVSGGWRGGGLAAVLMRRQHREQTMDGDCRALSLEPGGILKTSVTLVFRATLSRHRQAMREFSETDAEVKLCVFKCL